MYRGSRAHNNCGVQPLYFQQIILSKGFSPQEGTFRSRSGSPTTIAVRTGQKTLKVTQDNSLPALAGDLIAATLVFNYSIFDK